MLLWSFLAVAPTRRRPRPPRRTSTIGIGADVTAIDPHYHNVTPNNNVAAHIFDYLVLRDERPEADSRAWPNPGAPSIR